MEETATVVASNADGSVWVEAAMSNGCGGCAQSGHCGSGLLGQALGGNRGSRQLKLDDPVGLTVGDEVVIGLPEGALLRGAATVYGLPLLFMALLAIGGRAISPSEGSVALGGAAGFALGVWWARSLVNGAGSFGTQPLIMRRQDA